MRRHDALIPLTHDHHHALVHVRKMRLAADGEPSQRLAAAADYLRFYERDTLLHFREEEEVVFPLLIGREDAPLDLIRRLLWEHVCLHALVRELRLQVEAGDVRGDTVAQTAELLRGHIRAEEDELFPALERLVGDEELGAIDLAQRDRG